MSKQSSGGSESGSNKRLNSFSHAGSQIGWHGGARGDLIQKEGQAEVLSNLVFKIREGEGTGKAQEVISAVIMTEGG